MVKTPTQAGQIEELMKRVIALENALIEANSDLCKCYELLVKVSDLLGVK